MFTSAKNQLGLTQKPVTRLLKVFENQGIICRDRRRFILVGDRLPFWHYDI